MIAQVRRWLMTLLPAALALAVLGPIAVGAQQPVFHSTADVVSVDVAVHDGNKPVAALTAADFDLRDNGAAQAITTISYGTLPIDVRLVVDLSSSITPDQLARHEAAIRELESALTPDDRCEVSTFARRMTQAVALQTPPVATNFQRPLIDGTSYYDAAVLSMITVARPGRRQLTLLLTDGVDTASFFDDAALLDAAKRTDAVVDAVVAVASNNRSSVKPGSRLTSAVSPTGGQVVTIGVGADVGPALAAIVKDFRQSYVLNYTPAKVPLAGWHDITVTTPKHRSYAIRARRGYFGG